MIIKSAPAEGGRVPPTDYHPPHHPHLLFRSHFTGRKFSVLHLGGEEYWMAGTWLIFGENRLMLVKDQVFRVSELRECMVGVELKAPAITWHVAVS